MPIANLTAEQLTEKANAIRATCIQMTHDGKESHLNGALSCADILAVLFYNWLNIYPESPRHPERDRFLFSKGHACTALYAVMADCGYFPMEWLFDYAKDNTHLPTHPCIHALPMLENSSGSLGHGLGVGTGMAYGLKLKNSTSRVVALLSDGECNEGSTWEAAMFAAAKKLDNLIAIIDYNGVQSIGFTDELTGNTSFAQKFAAFGWDTLEINGLDNQEVLNALNQYPLPGGKPLAIIAKTRAGAGVSFMENQVLYHYRTPPIEEVERALAELKSQPFHLNKG